MNEAHSCHKKPKKTSKTLSRTFLEIVPATIVIFFPATLAEFSPHTAINHTQTVSAQRIPRDDLYDQQKNPLSEIQLEQAWDISTGSEEIIIAIIDDAIDINHPDLRDNMMQGWDFVDGDSNPSPGSCIDPLTQNTVFEGHGTAVAGVLGAVGDNLVGISGVNWRVKIMPLRIGCQFNANYEAQAVAYAIEHGAHIINASYGGPDSIARNQKVTELLEQATSQVLFVTSAGNSHVDNDDVAVYPGDIALDNVMTVAASSNHQLTEWSQYGVSSVDVAAPGVDLYTTQFNNNPVEKYGLVSGSSFSTAVVSGVAALILDRYRVNNLALPKPADVKAILQASVTPLTNQNARLKTDGIVNARSALDIFQSPRPVITLDKITFDDSQSHNHNAWVDPQENGTLILELDNYWDDIVSGSVTLSTADDELIISNAVQTLSAIQAGQKFHLNFPVQAKTFTGHKDFAFDLAINIAGARENAAYHRKFLLETGVLKNKNAISGRIQRDNFDDYQYYHLNVPENYERVAVELIYTPGDTRHLGMLASMGQKPLIHFRPYNGRAFWHRADVISNQQQGFDRLEMKIPGLQASTFNILLFNQPELSTTSDFQRNKAFNLKACYYSDFDGNQAPIVNAGSDRIVEAGESVRLEGEVSDSDGSITRFYWSASNDIALDNTDELVTGFIAPITGEFRFTLSAIDDDCKKSSDSVVIKVKNDVDQSSGLLINPRNIFTEENSNISVQIQANYLAQSITDLNLVSAPDRVIYEKSTDNNSGGRLIWQNAGPVGDYILKFSADIDGKTLVSSIAINIKARGATRSGGGCVSIKQNEFDPLFILYILISFLYLRKKTRIST